MSLGLDSHLDKILFLILMEEEFLKARKLYNEFDFSNSFKIFNYLK